MKTIGACSEIEHELPIADRIIRAAFKNPDDFEVEVELIPPHIAGHSHMVHVTSRRTQHRADVTERFGDHWLMGLEAKLKEGFFD